MSVSQIDVFMCLADGVVEILKFALLVWLGYDFRCI